MDKAWKRWKSFAKKVANIQANILLTVVYIFLIIPLGFILKIFFKDLLVKDFSSKNTKSFWNQRKNYSQNINTAKKQSS